ncbi:MAG TPA: ABC transporter permease [candidate division Zixibacteria bacterium]|nr:ABC transporter permease [candidate division Zixibacteria bacterium]MDD4918663.1 ABC transporter permease [candidate division Zixibacteria bacterium]MDM7971723.1 ABC transporter permease [candidate division Zixibacteria bacterium]HOD66996.1 ABC transporter permease [candidate division Zixibacteria bacterium]HOZ07153.1 ABC transporter permease [candidate division Zixibacteria bacterium]
MRKFWVVFKREYAQVVKKKSFLIGVLLTPALMAGFVVLPMLLADPGLDRPQSIAIIDQSSAGFGERLQERLVEVKIKETEAPLYDFRGFFTVAPGDDPGYRRVLDSLTAAINAQELKYVVVIRPNPQLSDTGVFAVTNATNFTILQTIENHASQLLSMERLRQSHVNVSVDSVLALTRRLDLQVRDAKGETMPFEYKYFGALIFVMVMFGMILGYGQMVMRSVIDEKNSRIMEVLISSVTPFQLMLGKVLGLGAATFTQAAIWVALGAVLYANKAALSVDSSIDRLLFNPVIVVFFVLYLTTGYLLFSTLFALVGSIVNSEKEAQNFVFPITMSLVLPVMIGIHVVQEPNSTLSLVLSYIPFLTPTMMMMRIIFIAPTMTEYSLFGGIVGQAVLGFVLVSLTTVAVIWLTAKIFRVGILMYGKRPTLPEIVKWVRY